MMPTRRRIAFLGFSLLFLAPALLMSDEAEWPPPEIRPHPSLEADLYRIGPDTDTEIGQGKAYVGERAVRFEITEGNNQGIWIVTLPGNMWARVDPVSRNCRPEKQDDEVFLMFNRHDTYAEACEPGELIDGHPTIRCFVKGLYWGLEPEAVIWKATDLGEAVIRSFNRKEKNAHGYELRNIRLGEPEASLFTCPEGAVTRDDGIQWKKILSLYKPAFKFWYVPIGFFFLFQFLMSFASGWRRLARKYGVDSTPREKVCSPSRARIGMWVYFYCLRLRAVPAGLHFSVSLPLRLSHSPFLIPWSEMHPVREIMTFKRVWIELAIGHPAIATLMIPKEIYEKKGH